jgi:hypothetical protein
MPFHSMETDHIDSGAASALGAAEQAVEPESQATPADACKVAFHAIETASPAACGECGGPEQVNRASDFQPDALSS